MALLDELRRRAEEEALPLRVVLKEALQAYALAALYALPEGQQVVFQGGTCLRLAYGGPRYSEDLDFVTTLPGDSLASLLPAVEPPLARLGPLFEGALTLRVQKQSESLTRWRLSLAGPRQRDSTSISLEFAAFPAHTSQPVALTLPPDLPRLPLVVVRAETPTEIMADKLAAIAGRDYAKARDVFDLWFLSRRGVAPNREMVKLKMKGYGVLPEALQPRLARFTPAMLQQELENFLPARQRTALLADDTLRQMLAEVHALLPALSL
ncbi:MAG: nucleotidyl transferase AbiEii/AbiGii toxin family protein [Chloroflexi bacterium]|nr:nucleotidyl transferase AbiEii/AbiGii toxin family protein [Chloroflexota bacterium]